MAEREIEKAAKMLRDCTRLLVFAGAGLSAESGIPTFRDQGGLWEKHRVEDVAAPEGFQRDPALVWRFYAERQQQLATVRPNPGHFALARMEQIYAPDGFLLVTQNIDDLSERAGSRQIAKIHGDLMAVWCTRCSWRGSFDVPLEPEGLLADERTLPSCPECGSLARPGIVWFGESLPRAVINQALAFSLEADAILIVGTSGAVSGGYGLADNVSALGGGVIELNPQETCLSHLADVCLRAPSAEALPALLSLL